MVSETKVILLRLSLVFEAFHRLLWGLDMMYDVFDDGWGRIRNGL